MITRSRSRIAFSLDVAKIKAGGRLEMTFEACHLNQIVSEVIEDLSSMYGDRFLLSAAEQIDGYWNCARIRRILENLLTNAIKYGSPLTPVTVSMIRGDDDRVRITVHNNGPVIPAEEVSYLFDPFRRSNTALTDGQKGWGLGLTLVKGITEAHGGTVQVESGMQQGTTFTVTIPLDSRPK